MNTYEIVLLLSGGVIISYIFNLIAKKFAIPQCYYLGTGFARASFWTKLTASYICQQNG
jgi:pantothenate kinase